MQVSDFLGIDIIVLLHTKTKGHWNCNKDQINRTLIYVIENDGWLYKLRRLPETIKTKLNIIK